MNLEQKIASELDAKIAQLAELQREIDDLRAVQRVAAKGFFSVGPVPSSTVSSGQQPTTRTQSARALLLAVAQSLPGTFTRTEVTAVARERYPHKEFKENSTATYLGEFSRNGELELVTEARAGAAAVYRRTGSGEQSLALNFPNGTTPVTNGNT